LAKRWRWSRDRVKRFFNQLESREQIRQHKNPAFTKIAVSNYDEIQSFDKAVNRQLKRHQTGSRRAADESLRTNDNYEKNVQSSVQQALEEHGVNTLDMDSSASAPASLAGNNLLTRLGDTNSTVSRDDIAKAAEAMHRQGIRF